MNAISNGGTIGMGAKYTTSTTIRQWSYNSEARTATRRSLTQVVLTALHLRTDSYLHRNY